MPASKFVESHEHIYGLKVTARDPTTCSVQSVVCRFCVGFGREDQFGKKRRRQGEDEFFTIFRSDLYRKHLEIFHPIKWKKYKNLSAAKDQEAFFATSPGRFEGPLGDRLRLRLRREIVEIVMALCCSDEQSGRIFALLEEVDYEFYELSLDSRRRFSTCIKCFSRGLSFEKVASMMDDIQAETGNPTLGECSAALVSDYVQIASIHSVQTLSEIFRHVMCFSLRLHISKHHGQSYLDVRMRFHWDGAIRELHLTAFPLLEQSQEGAAKMSSELERFLTAVFTDDWKKRCISVSFDGVNKAMQPMHELVSRLSEVCACGKYGIWRGFHHLNMFMEKNFSDSLKCSFHPQLHSLMVYLRLQRRFSVEMPREILVRSYGPRWDGVFDITTWLVNNQHRITQYMDEEHAPCVPDAKWWILLHAANAFLSKWLSVVKVPFAGGVPTSQQKSSVQSLIREYSDMSGMMGPLSADQIHEVLAQETCVKSDNFVWREADIRRFLEGLGSWARTALKSLGKDDLLNLISSVGSLFVDAADGISKICLVEANDLHPMLPSEVHKLTKQEFTSHLYLYSRGWGQFLSEKDIKLVLSDFLDFRRFVMRERFHGDSLRIKSDPSSFEEEWKCTFGTLPHLQAFCGGLASARPRTAVVKSSDCIVARCETKNDSRANLTRESLEGVLHSKQYRDLMELKQEMSLAPPHNKNGGSSLYIPHEEERRDLTELTSEEKLSLLSVLHSKQPSAQGKG